MHAANRTLILPNLHSDVIPTDTDYMSMTITFADHMTVHAMYVDCPIMGDAVKEHERPYREQPNINAAIMSMIRNCLCFLCLSAQLLVQLGVEVKIDTGYCDGGNYSQ